jgi:zinc protease
MRKLPAALALAAVMAFPEALRGIELSTDEPRIPHPASRIPEQDTLTTQFSVSGVQVIHRRSTASDVVAVSLYLLGGTRQLTPETQGIEALVLAASEYGTRAYPGPAVRRARARTGSRMVITADADWTVFGFQGIKQEFDSSWAIFAERLMRPTIDQASVTLVRDQLLGDVRNRRNTPDALVHYLADSLAYADHPYVLEPTGTEQSLARLTAADLRRYHSTQLVTSRMLLVVVGDVPREKIERLVAGTIGRLPRGSYTWTLPATPPERAGTMLVRHRVIPTNYILGYFTGPAASSPDYPAFRVAVAILSARLHDAIRERNALSYAAYAPFLERAAPAGGMYATTGSPERVISIMRGELKSLQTDELSDDGLDDFVEQFITDYYTENETNAAQADWLARAHLYRGDYTAAYRFMDDLRHVSAADIRRVARQYMKNVRFAYVGDGSKVGD